MKLNHWIVALLAALFGWCAAVLVRHPAQGTTAGGRKVLLYQSPMHPWVKSNRPGKCTVCGMELVPIYEGGRPVNTGVSDVVMLPEGSANAVGIQIAEVTRKKLVRTLRVAGMIGEDESRHGVISAPVEGRLDGLAMSCDGQQITRRQPLATIFSRTLLNAAHEYLAAVKQGGSEVDAAKMRLMRYGLVWEQIAAIPTRQEDDSYFGILAPLSGTIVKSYVSEGQYVKEGDKLFEIADFTRMWFMFTAYERDLPSIRVGQVVEVKTPSLPGETLKARVGFISPNLDEATRSARVRVVLENPERRIKNNTFAEGMLEADAPEVLAIPRTAVLWPGTQPRVYIEKEPSCYVRRMVKLGRAGDEDWEVLDGLKEGERVVRTGSLLVDSQAQLAEDSPQ